MSKKQLRLFLDESLAATRVTSLEPAVGEISTPSMQPVVPWKTLLELIGDINYGGRVTDDKVEFLFTLFFNIFLWYLLNCLRTKGSALRSIFASSIFYR